MRSWDVIRAGAAHIERDEHLREVVEAGQPLRVKFGMDPTAPDIHLGHTVVLRKLRQFQDLGHTAVLVIGDFTARIGDPSGRSETRPMLDEATIELNLQTFREQAFHVLRRDNFEERRQSEWFGSMGLADVIKLAQKVTLAQLLQRDDFSKRVAAGDPISLHEFLYPLMQGFDSVAVQADVELGGTDQLYNLLFARDVQRDSGMRAQDILTMPILEGLDGKQKMSKSLGNYVAVTDPPAEMYGKLMSVPDPLIGRYRALVCGDVEGAQAVDGEVAAGRMNPRDAKREMAADIVALFHDAAAAREAAAQFAGQFQRGGLPADVPEVYEGELQQPDLDETGESKPSSYRAVLQDLLAKAFGDSATTSETGRLISQGGVRVNDAVISDPAAAYVPADGDLWRIGKRRAVRVRTGRRPG